MKIVEEKAKEYADQCYAINPDEIGGVLYRETIKDFTAGYKTAFKWISVNDEMPNDDRAILAMNKESKLVWSSNMEDGEILPYVDLMFGEEEPATHWREIEIEL